MIPAPKFKWNVKPNQVEALTRRYKDRALDSVQEVIEDVADWAANDIRQLKIYSGSPTGTRWHDFINDERGNQDGARKDTGEMFNSVGSTPARYLAEGEYDAEFGLKLPSAGGRKYFLEQDQGFPLQLASGEVRQVPGMHTFDFILPALKRKMNKQMLRRGFLRGKRDTRGERVLSDAPKMGFESAWSQEFSNSRTPDQVIAGQKRQIRFYEQQIRRDAIRRANIDSYRSSKENIFGSITNQIDRYKK